jgi:hypothetical protein
MNETVKEHSLLTLHYRLATADDTELVSTFGAKPATLQLGSGELAPVLERHLVGLPVGQRTVFLLESEQAFGPHNPQLMQRFARSELPECRGTARDGSDRIQGAQRRRLHRPGARADGGERFDRLQPPARRQGHPLRGGRDRNPVMDILLANPRGFCAGVERAIEIVERALERYGAPIYVRHEVVHNKFVVDGLRAKGAVFVEELDEVPDGATVIFSAHGVSQAVRQEAERSGLRVFDATCPLVTKVHGEVQRQRDGGSRDRHDRPSRPSRGGRHDGAGSGGMHLVEKVEDVSKLQVADESRWPMSRRPRCRSTMPLLSSPR